MASIVMMQPDVDQLVVASSVDAGVGHLVHEIHQPFSK